MYIHGIIIVLDVRTVRLFLEIMTTVETIPSIASDYLYSESNFDGYHAAPLLIIGEDAKPELVAKQDGIGRNFDKLVRAELDGTVKPHIVDFVAHAIKLRMHQREGLNGISYMGRPNTDPDSSACNITLSEITEACEKLKHGEGSVIQNEIARRAFGMTSVEYANLTVVGESRKDLEAEMWDEVSELTGKDATPRPEDMYGLKVLEFDRDIRADINIGAMRIGMKRHLGETEYGAQVKARTTAIIKPINLLRHMGKSQEDYYALTGALQETAQRHGDFSQIPAFVDAVKWLVGTSLPAGIVLARNETVYGFTE